MQLSHFYTRTCTYIHVRKCKIRTHNTTLHTCIVYYMYAAQTLLKEIPCQGKVIGQEPWEVANDLSGDEDNQYDTGAKHDL